MTHPDPPFLPGRDQQPDREKHPQRHHRRTTLLTMAIAFCVAIAILAIMNFASSLNDENNQRHPALALLIATPAVGLSILGIIALVERRNQYGRGGRSTADTRGHSNPQHGAPPPFAPRTTSSAPGPKGATGNPQPEDLDNNTTQVHMPASTGTLGPSWTLTPLCLLAPQGLVATGRWTKVENLRCQPCLQYALSEEYELKDRAAMIFQFGN